MAKRASKGSPAKKSAATKRPAKKQPPAKKKKKKKKPIAKKPARARPAKITVAEIDRRLALARRAANAQRSKLSGLQERLVRACEVMQVEATDIGVASVLRVKFPPRMHATKWRSPWVLAARFSFADGMTYDALHAVFATWLRDGRSMRRINRDRGGRIVVRYVDRGKPNDYVLSETMAWSPCLQRAMQRTDPDDDLVFEGRGSLAIRYGSQREDGERASTIPSVIVWLSEGVGANIMTAKE